MTDLLTTPTTSTTVQRIGGALALASVVVMYAGFSQESLVTHDAGLGRLRTVYGGASLTRVFAGGYLEAVSFLLMAAAMVVVARVVGRSGEVSALGATAFLGLGWALIATVYAVGFPPAAAAIYGLQHGGDVRTAAMVNDVRNYAFVLQTALQGGMALALGIAAVAGRVMTRWAGWLGVVVGVVGIVGAPFAGNVAGLLWTVWWVGIGVLLVRARPGDPS